MRGFSGILKSEERPCLQRSYGQYNRKFPEDKANRCDEAYDIMFDGVLLNASQLRREYGKQKLDELLAAMWEAHGIGMLSRLKGSYVLSLWDKAGDTVVISGDRLNKRPLYYHFSGNTVFFSSRYLDLTALLAENGIFPAYSHAAFAMLSSIGQLYEQFTPLQEVYCLRPFEYLICQNGKIELAGGECSVEESTASAEELLEQFDMLFADAVCLQYEKNVECGYEQVTSLSGGMDTRSVALMGQRLGYTLDRSFCYCQSGAADEKIARKLAEKLDVPFEFLPLDGGAFLLRAEDHGRRNECLISYGGSTGALTMAESMPMESVGIIHSGIFGGEIMASIFRADDARRPMVALTGPAREEFYRLLQPNLTHGHMELRLLMRGCLNFVRMFESRAEVISPFMDEDVYAFLKTVPFEMRKARMFYSRWMRRKIPNSLPTTYYRVPMNAPKLLLEFVPRFLARVPIYMKSYDMHPMQQWYDQQPELRRGMEALADKYSQNALPEEIRVSLLEQCHCGEPRRIMYGVSALLAAWLTEEAQRG